MSQKGSITPDDAVNMLRVGQRDPVWWVQDILGSKPWPVQTEILESVRDNPKTVVPSCHGSGKSWTAGRVTGWFLNCFPESLVVTTAPTYRQVRDIVWQEIRRAYSKAKRPLGGKLLPVETRWEIADGWLAFGFATRVPDQFQGLHAPYVLVVADEAPGIPPAIWEAIEGVLSSGTTRLLAIGNPIEPSGPFFEMCKPGSGANVIHISVFDTPNFTAFGITPEDIANGTWRQKITGPLPLPSLVTPDWVAGRYRKWGPTSPMYLSRVKGEFPQSATDALITLAWVEQAQHRELVRDGKILLAADIARFGDDETVLCMRQGPVARVVDSWGKTDTMETAGRIVNWYRRLGASTVGVDSAGVGGGVADRLHELSIPCVELNAGEGADDEHNLNARAEWYWALRERFEAGEIDLDPKDEELAAQLTSLKYKFRSNGKVQIESKEDMKKRGLSSPDRADALMLAYAMADRTGDILIPGSRTNIGRKSDKQWNETFPPIPGTETTRRFY